MFQFTLLLPFLFSVASGIAPIDESKCNETKCCYHAGFGPMLSYEVLGEQSVAIELEGTQPDGYIALGFSTHPNMEQAVVLFCTSKGSSVYIAYTTGMMKPTSVSSGANAVMKEIGADGGKLICRFTLSTNVSIPNMSSMSNLNNSFYILMAQGASSSPGELTYHRNSRSASASKLNVGDRRCIQMTPNHGGISPSVRIALKKTHGSLMILAWCLFVGTAIIIGRYFRKVWPSTKLFGKDIWFTIHQSCNISGIILMIIALICVLVSFDGKWQGPTKGTPMSTWTNDKGAMHSLLGTLTLIFAFLQPLNAVFRPHPGPTVKRQIFNWLHRCNGLCGFLFSAATIWYSTYFPFYPQSGTYNYAAKGSVLAYWAILGFVVVGLEIHLCFTETFRTDGDGRIAYVNNSSGGAISDLSMPPGEKPIAWRPKARIVRIILLSIFLLAASVIPVFLVVLIASGALQ